MTPYACPSAIAPLARAAIPLRVAMVTAEPIPAASRVTRRAESLARAGHQVAVFRLAGEGLDPEETVCGVRYVRLQDWLRHGSLTDRIAPFLRQKLIAAAITAAVAGHRPDAVHAHGFKSLTVAIRAASKCGASVIYDVPDRGGDPLPVLAAWRSTLERRALARVAACLAADPLAARQLVSKYGVPQPTIVADVESAANQDGEHLLLQVYAAVANRPRGLPAAMARRALATTRRPAAQSRAVLVEG